MEIQLDECCFWCGNEKDLLIGKDQITYCKMCFEDETENKLEDLYENTRTEFFPSIDIICDKILLGNNDGGREIEKLKENGVTNILMCGNTLRKYHEQCFTYKQILLEDDPKEDILKYFKECCEWIDQADGNVYVHCHVGLSRSPTIVIAYLMWKEGMSYIKAKEFVKSKRPIINPNSGFEKQLKEFEKMINISKNILIN